MDQDAITRKRDWVASGSSKVSRDRSSSSTSPSLLDPRVPVTLFRGGIECAKPIGSMLTRRLTSAAYAPNTRPDTRTTIACQPHLSPSLSSARDAHGRGIGVSARGCQECYQIGDLIGFCRSMQAYAMADRLRNPVASPLKQRREYNRPNEVHSMEPDIKQAVVRRPREIRHQRSCGTPPRISHLRNAQSINVSMDGPSARPSSVSAYSTLGGTCG